jgi:hypothetical protein
MYLLVTPSSLSFKDILIISKLPIANKNQIFTSKGPFTRTTKTLCGLKLGFLLEATVAVITKLKVMVSCVLKTTNF